jgi:hypothetical protein
VKKKKALHQERGREGARKSKAEWMMMLATKQRGTASRNTIADASQWRWAARVPLQANMGSVQSRGLVR